MSWAPRLLLRLGLATVLALVLLVALSPSCPRLRFPFLAASTIGGAAGVLLYVLVTRRRPVLPSAAARLPLVVVSCALLGLAAANEEVVWRRVVLGELMRGGSVAAVLGSSLGFAVSHRARPGLHLGTGAVFGCVYVATGALAACIAAHWTYNLLLLWRTDRSRHDRGAPP